MRTQTRLTHDCATPGRKTETAAGLMLLIALLFIPRSLAQSCTAPNALTSAAHAHPGEATAIALSNWFGEHRQYDCAAAALEPALAVQPRSAHMLYLRALDLFAAGHGEQAIEPLRTAITVAPGALPPHLLLASVLASLGHAPEAESEWKTALELDPASPGALDGLARLRIDAGDPASAISLLEGAPHALVVREQDLALDLARAYGKAGMLDKAETLLAEAERRAPGAARLAEGLETVLVLETHYQAAADLARRYAASQPHSIDAQRMLLRALVLNHDSAAARPLAQRLLAGSPHDFDFLYLSGILEREAGQYQAARAHLQEAVSLQPDEASARFNLGMALAALNDHAGARIQLEQALKLGTQDPQVSFALATSLRALGDTDGARRQLALYQQALHAEAARTESKSKAAQADQAMAAGDAGRAATLLREALAATPSDAQLAYRLATALAKAGDAAGARAALAQTVSLDPTFAIAQYQLGSLAEAAGETTEAEKRLRLATESAPGYAPAWLSLAAVLREQKRLAEAREAVATALRLDPENTGARSLEEALRAGQP